MQSEGNEGHKKLHRLRILSILYHILYFLCCYLFNNVYFFSSMYFFTKNFLTILNYKAHNINTRAHAVHAQSLAGQAMV